MDQEKLRRSFILNYAYLARKMTTEEVLLECVSQSLISVNENELIVSEKTETKRVEKLMLLLHRRYGVDPSVFLRLFTIVKKVNGEGNGFMDHIVERLSREPPPLPAQSRLPILGERERAVLVRSSDLLSSSLDVEEILPDLVSELVVDVEECDWVKSAQDFTERCKRLLQLLHQMGLVEFQKFLSVLSDNEQYKPLSEKLKEELLRDASHQFGTDQEDYGTAGEDIDVIDFCENIGVRIPSKWRVLGIALGVPSEQLDGIEQLCRDDQSQCFAKVFDYWKNNPTIASFSWSGVVQALQKNYIGENALATELMKIYSLQESSPKPMQLKDPPTLPDFLEHVAHFIPNQYIKFGLVIGVGNEDLKGYEAAHKGNQLRCFESVFKYWENGQPNAKPFKWSTVLTALRRRMMGENALAMKLERKITAFL